jgi:hypothetical protein
MCLKTKSGSVSLVKRQPPINPPSASLIFYFLKLIIVV